MSHNYLYTSITFPLSGPPFKVTFLSNNECQRFLSPYWVVPPGSPLCDPGQSSVFQHPCRHPFSKIMSQVPFPSFKSYLIKLIKVTPTGINRPQTGTPLLSSTYHLILYCLLFPPPIPDPRPKEPNLNLSCRYSTNDRDSEPIGTLSVREVLVGPGSLLSQSYVFYFLRQFRWEFLRKGIWNSFVE